MTDLVKLIAADQSVRLIPDATTAEELRKLDDFWTDKTVDGPDLGLAAASGQAMRAALEGDGIDADMPDAVRDVVSGAHHFAILPMALAACLVGALAIGGFLWRTQVSDGTAPTPEKRSAASAPYVFARPDRPAAGAARPQEPESAGGLQAATVRTSIADVDSLTRSEIHEMQRLLTLLGYGPLVQDGLPSKALDEAMSRFRSDQGLNPRDPRPREGLVMLRLAARAEALRAPRDGVPDR